MRKLWPVIVLSLVIVAPAAASPQGHDDYNIMVPEKAAKPRAHQRRGSSVIVAPTPLPPPLHYLPPPVQSDVAPPPVVAPPVVAPSGQLVPSPPTYSPSGPHGTESYQDRAVRCAHEAGVNSGAVGNPSAFIGSCINQ